MKKLLLIMFLASTVIGQANHTGWPLELLSWNVDKAYPGIEYNYRLGVKGGEYPYTFALRHGPTGMTVDSTGALIWTPASAMVDSVRVVVKDMLNDSLVVEYGITATTTGFYFVDSATGSNSNAGTESAPWATMAYAAATADSSAYTYVKKGTYSETFNMTATGCGRFIAYGDSVKIIGAGTGSASFSPVGSNRIWQGFEIDGSGLRWIFSITGAGCQKMIFRKNEMYNVMDTTSMNPAFLFFWDQGAPYPNIVIQDNVFHGVVDKKIHHGASVTSYDMQNSLYENNHVYDIDGRGVNEKVDGKRNTFRANIFHDIEGYQAIVLNSNPNSDSTEICYNHIYDCPVGGLMLGLNGQYVANIFVHHNTFKSHVTLANFVIGGANSNNINIYKNIIGQGLDYPYSLGGWPTDFKTKADIDSNIIYGRVDSTRVSGSGKTLSLLQWRDSTFDINSPYMQLTYDANNIPILSDSLLNIYGHLANSFADGETPVIIVEQPHDSTVTEGQTVSFSVTATNATGYQWYGNGSLISGATSSTYSFTATYSLTGSSIWCLVSNATDTISSDTVTLTVNSVAKTPATITQQPVSDTVTAGQSATFFVTASGSGLTYQWYRNDSLIIGETNDTLTYTSRSGLGYTDTLYCNLTTDTTISTDTVTLTVNALSSAAIGYFDGSYLTVGLFKQPTGTASKNTGTVVPVKGPNSPATVTATLENLAVDYGWRSDLQSYRFGQGINNIVYSNDIGDLSGNKLTIAAWMKVASVASAQNIWAKVLSGTVKIVVHRQHNDTFEIRVCNGSSASIMRFLRPSGHAEPNTLFSMITVIDVTQAVNTDRIKVYVDGIACSVAGTPGTIPTTLPNVSTTALRVGGWGAADPLAGINGEMYTMLTFNTAKTESEVSALHALGPDLGGLTLQSDGILYSAKRVWISTSSTDMNLATNYSGSGPILETDTLIFNGTSVVNATATANLSVAHVDIQSTYSGNWVMTGYSLTLNNGGLLRSGSGTFTLRTGVTFNGNGKLYTNATSGTNISSTSCNITFNGNDTIESNKSFTVRSIIVNNRLMKFGTGSVTLHTPSNNVPLTLGENSELAGGSASVSVGGFLINVYTSLTSLFSIHPTAKMNGVYGFGVSALNTTGEITINIPKFISSTMNLTLAVGTSGQTGKVIYNMTDTISCKILSVYSFNTGGGGLTFNSNSNPVSCERLDAGSQFLGCKLHLNLQNTYVDIRDIISSKTEADSTIFDMTGSTVQNSNILLKPMQRIDGSPTFLPCNDLFMGHSMLVGVWYRNVAHQYENMYGNRVYVNKAITGSRISNVSDRIDSCLTAYTPNRFFMWTGTNDLNFDDATKFDSAVAWYFTYWTQIISKVKAAGIDSIYIVDMPPRGTVEAPMSVTKQANFKMFNAALRDSAFANGCYFIATYDSLEEPTGVLNPEYTTDGLHPTFTQAGVEYCAYLFSLAQTPPPPTITLGTDTLKLNAKHTGTTQWLQNGSVIGSGSSISLNADSAFYAGTKIEAVTGSNKSTWQFKASGNKRSINFK